MSAREELATVLAEHRADVTSYDATDLCGCWCGWGTSDWDALHLHVADALLASPVLAGVIQEAKAEAWDEGRRTGSSRAMRKMSDEPGLPLAAEADNPYREGGA